MRGLPAIGLLVSAAAHNFILCADAQQVGGFSADLAFSFRCSGDAFQETAEAIERFLRGKGFKVMDLARLLRERKLPPLFSDVYIKGIDERQRMIYFSSTPFQSGWYDVQFYTPPPTQHAEAEENQLLIFVSESLGCRVGRRIDRKENGPERREYYHQVFRQIRDQIREANGEL
jgi:hypothetical protein